IAWCRSSCSPTTKNVALSPSLSRASRTAGVASSSGPSSKVRTAVEPPPSTRLSAGISRQRSMVSTCWRKLGIEALLPGLQQSLAQLALLLRGRVEGGGVRQGVQRTEAEQPLEQLRGAVQHRAELRAPRLLDQPALEQRADRGLRG